MQTLGRKASFGAFRFIMEVSSYVMFAKFESL